MNMTIFSGGTGSSQLVRGLREICQTNKITHIINLYDDGKSTGVCRNVCDTLGPSDMRKVHYLHYTCKQYADARNSFIEKLYKERYDFGATKEDFSKAYDKVMSIINSFETKNIFDEKYKKSFINCVEKFFSLAADKEIYNFNDFSIANIIYSVLFRTIGIEKTNKFMLDFLELTTVDILVNSDINYVLGANILDSFNEEYMLFDEESIVSLDSTDELITDVEFLNYNYNRHALTDNGNYKKLNRKIIDELNNTDLIIFSSGTQWSSLLPTLKNEEIKEALYKNRNKCILVMNNYDDKDMRGCDALYILKQYPKNILADNMTVLYNSDADDLMKLKDSIIDEFNCRHVEYSMGYDDRGKHDSFKLASAIYSIYYGVDFTRDYNNIYVDFDDTIIARKCSDYDYHNIEFLKTFKNKGKNVRILSGNSYADIEKWILTDKLVVWADSCSNRYYNDSFETIKKNVIAKEHELKIVKFLNKYTEDKNIDLRDDRFNITCINVKPLTNSERNLLCDYWNQIREYDDPIARVVGTTSLEFVIKSNSKLDALNWELDNDSSLSIDDILFIGDEKDGNDKCLFETIPNSIKVKSPEDTYIILYCMLRNSDKEIYHD